MQKIINDIDYWDILKNNYIGHQVYKLLSNQIINNNYILKIIIFSYMS